MLLKDHDGDTIDLGPHAMKPENLLVTITRSTGGPPVSVSLTFTQTVRLIGAISD